MACAPASPRLSVRAQTSAVSVRDCIRTFPPQGLHIAKYNRKPPAKWEQCRPIVYGPPGCIYVPLFNLCSKDRINNSCPGSSAMPVCKCIKSMNWSLQFACEMGLDASGQVMV